MLFVAIGVPSHVRSVQSLQTRCFKSRLFVVPVRSAPDGLFFVGGGVNWKCEVIEVRRGSLKGTDTVLVVDFKFACHDGKIRPEDALAGARGLAATKHGLADPKDLRALVHRAENTQSERYSH